MTYHTLSFPPALQAWVDARIAEGRYTDVADYVRDLVRRDQDLADDDTRWVRAMIDEGLASGVIEAEPEDVLREIMAEIPDD
jgi:antitoxin ParD1/3/4